MPDDRIIPFPLNRSAIDDQPALGCPFQAQAELRLAMLHRLVKGLAQAQARSALVDDVEEQCRHARALLREVAELYQQALADAARRARHAQGLR